MIYSSILENYNIVLFLIISIFMSIEDIRKMEVSLIKQFILFLLAMYIFIYDKELNYTFTFIALAIVFIILIFIKIGGADKKIIILSVVVLKNDILIFFYILSIVYLINWIKLKKYDKKTNGKYPFLPIISVSLLLTFIIKIYL